MLREADRRIERYQIDRHTPGFVPCDFSAAYRALRALANGPAAPGRLFCEWGSGFGVVTCLAALLDFDACGIEIDGDLVEEARRLADDFGLPAEFVRGSFLPDGADLGGGEFAWLTTDADSAEDDLGLAADDFDVIFAYPWPDEEEAVAELFERHARAGAVLLSYHGDADVRARRNIRPKARRRANR